MERHRYGSLLGVEMKGSRTGAPPENAATFANEELCPIRVDATTPFAR
jgi:hypothetical protein